MGKVELRSATKEDVAEFYEGMSLYSLRGIAAVLDGKVVGIGGVYRVGKQMVVFTEMRDELKGRKKDIIRASRLVLDIINRYSLVIAYASPELDTAENFCQHFGFEKQETKFEGRSVLVRTNRYGTI